MKVKIAVIAAGLFAAAATHAASISLDVYTGGRWVRLVPGSNTGGRVINGVTDRASRGERVRANFSASTYAEWCNPIITACFVSSQAGSFDIYGTSPWLPSSATFTVPTSPAWDNNYVNVCTVSGRFPMRIPVGSR